MKVLKNCKIFDPIVGLSKFNQDIIYDNKNILNIKKSSNENYENFDQIDIKGRTIFPGLIDIHVHFREPGETHKEDISSGSAILFRDTLLIYSFIASFFVKLFAILVFVKPGKIAFTLKFFTPLSLDSVTAKLLIAALEEE